MFQLVMLCLQVPGKPVYAEGQPSLKRTELEMYEAKIILWDTNHFFIGFQAENFESPSIYIYIYPATVIS